MNNARKIGQLIKRLRKEIGLTQIDVADSVGLSERTISSIENGSVDTSVNTLLLIAECLDVPAWRLLQFSKSETKTTAKRYDAIATLFATISDFSDREIAQMIDQAELVKKNRR